MALVRLVAGTRFAGDFRVIRLLNEGGMGAVYLAEQRSTGALRALKIMLPQLVSDPRHRKRFEQEARVGSLIESDHVVQVVAAGVDAPTGTPWLAMELLRGEDLASLLARRGYLPLAEVTAILAQLCHALGAAHRAGIVHRDLKPENVFLSAPRRAEASSEVKVLDFGIAKMAAEAFTTGTGSIGSPMWMAPEQTTPKALISPAVDVWPLGLLAFHLLTGVSYWHTANTNGALAALLREALVDPLPPATQRAHDYGVESQLPDRFDPWFARCLERDPRKRFANATETFAAFIAGVVGPDSGVTEEALVAEYGEDRTAIQSFRSLAPASVDAPPSGGADDDTLLFARPESSAIPDPVPPPAPQGELARQGFRAHATGAGTSRSTPPARTRRWSGFAVALASIVASASLVTAFAMTRRDQPTGAPPLASAPPPDVAVASPAPSAAAPREPRRVRIPAATFVMGSPAGEDADERAPRKVMIDAFEIDAMETTVLAWTLCEERGACPSILEASKATSPACNRPYKNRLDHPINCVTWDEAATFCGAIGERLPTEAEWEYAAAGGKEGRTNPYPWGATPGPSRANGAGKDDGFELTAPVGTFPHGATEPGVLDLAGNVAEWVADPYSRVLMPGVSMPESRRIVRGGSYASDARGLRASKRGKEAPEVRAPTIGFRCARAPG